MDRACYPATVEEYFSMAKQHERDATPFLPYVPIGSSLDSDLCAEWQARSSRSATWNVFGGGVLRPDDHTWLFRAREAAKAVAFAASEWCAVLDVKVDKDVKLVRLKAALQSAAKFDLRGRGDTDLADALQAVRKNAASDRNLPAMRAAAQALREIASLTGDTVTVKQRRFRAPPCPRCKSPAALSGTSSEERFRRVKCKNKRCGYTWKITLNDR